MKQISKNIYLGQPITDLREIGRLAREGKSIVQKTYNFDKVNYTVRPASFFVNWPLAMILNYQFYYSIKLNKNA